METTMEYTRLGNTGVKVSRLCLGCMSFGSASWRPWVLERDDAAPFFKRAIEAGINFFDRPPPSHRLPSGFSSR
jgi:aryl-alcohol dehydrogenase-like predicted oxidoreductase